MRETGGRIVKCVFAICLLLVSAAALTGCSSRIGDFTMISSRNFDPEDEYVRTGRNIQGTDFKHIIIFVPTGIPSLEDAIDQALNRTDSDYMTNAAVHTSWWWIPYIYGRSGYRVTGDTWKRVENGAVASSIDQ